VMTARGFCRANLARIDPLFQSWVTNSGQARSVEWFQKVAHDRLAFTKSVPQRGSVWLKPISNSSIATLSHTLPRCGTDFNQFQIQNSNFTPNCITRGSPAEVIEPKPAEPSTTFGAASGGVLVKLKTSPRS